MTGDTENNLENVAPPPKKKAAAKKKRQPSAAELKRQIADMKAKLAQKDEMIETQQDLIDTQQEAIEAVAGQEIHQGEKIADVQILSERWDRQLGEVEPGDPLWWLDGDEEDNSGFIAEIPQPEDQPVMYQVKVGEKNAYFGNVEDAGEMGEFWADKASGARTLRAVDNPVEIGQFSDANNHHIAQQAPREMASHGNARDAFSDAEHIIVDERTIDVLGPDQVEMAAFMEQELQVLIHETTNPEEIPIPVVINNGVHQYFVRGQVQTVKRKFIEILGRCKRTTFTTEQYKDGTGADAYRYPSHTALLYPFAVRYDPDPRGARWLAALLAEEQ